MLGGSGRALMTLVFAGRRCLSLLTPFPTILVRSRSTFIPSWPATLSPPVASTRRSSNDGNNSQPIASSAQRHGLIRVLVAPLSMAAARSRAGDSSDKSGSSSSSSSSSRKPRHYPSSTSPSPSSTPGGAKRRPSPGAAATGGRYFATSPGRSAPWGTGAVGGVEGRGWGPASAAGGRGASVAGGRGSRAPTARGLHDKKPYIPRPQSFGEVPEDQLQVAFTRSSGAGGQNVNKVSTKVEMRFVVSEADWLPHDVRLRLARQEKGRVNDKGELVVTAQEFRTQKQNRSHALQKLREMINEAWEPAKERKMRTGISKKGKEIRKQEKLHRSKVKAGRSKLSSRDFD